MKKILNFLNENHWYLIAVVLIATAIFITYGCESQVHSIIYPDRMVGRTELQTELSYYVGLAKARDEELDRKDAGKQALLDAFNVISQTGSINPSGLLSLAGTIGAISFGLNRNQALKKQNSKQTLERL